VYVIGLVHAVYAAVSREQEKAAPVAELVNEKVAVGELVGDTGFDVMTGVGVFWAACAPAARGPASSTAPATAATERARVRGSDIRNQSGGLGGRYVPMSAVLRAGQDD